MRISNDEKDKEAIELSKRSKSWLFNNDPLTTNIYELTSNEANDFIIDIPQHLVIDRSKKAQTLDYDKKDRKKCGLCKQLWIGVAAVLVIGCVYFKNDIIGVMNHNHSANQAAMQRKILGDVAAPLKWEKFEPDDTWPYTKDNWPLTDVIVLDSGWYILKKAELVAEDGGKESTLEYSGPFEFENIGKRQSEWFNKLPGSEQSVYRKYFEENQKWHNKCMEITVPEVINTEAVKESEIWDPAAWMPIPGATYSMKISPKISDKELIDKTDKYQAGVVQFWAKLGEQNYLTSWMSDENEAQGMAEMTEYLTKIEIEKASEKHAAATAENKAAHREEVEKKEQELAEKITAHNQELADKITAHDQKFAEKTTAHDQKLAEKTTAHDQKLADQTAAHKRELADKTTAHKQTSEELKLKKAREKELADNLTKLKQEQKNDKQKHQRLEENIKSMQRDVRDAQKREKANRRNKADESSASQTMTWTYNIIVVLVFLFSIY